MALSFFNLFYPSANNGSVIIRVIKNKAEKTKTLGICIAKHQAIAPTQSASSGKLRWTNERLIHIAGMVLLILIIYGNTLTAPFQWDENIFIVNNPIVKNLHYFTSPSTAKALELYSSFISRYIGYLTFAFNYSLHGLSVTGYHILDIGIHISNAILVYLIVILTFRTPFMTSSALDRQGHNIAFITSLLFACHPIQTEAVTYIFQRFASLVAFFYLISLVAYIKSRLSCDSKRHLFYAIAFFSAVLAMKTKENAFTLPIIMALYEFCFFSGSKKSRLLFLAPVLMTLMIIPLTLIEISGSQHLNPGRYGTEVFQQDAYFFTQLRVIVTYLRLLFFPVNQNIGYDYPIFTSFFEISVILSFLFLLSLLSFGVFLVTRNPSAVHSDDSQLVRLMGFGILWFFITLSVESSIIPIPMLINEYRVYLPSVGVIISIVTLIFIVVVKLKVDVKATVAALILIGVSLSAATFLRNDLWTDRIKLWEDTVQKSPMNAVAHDQLGNAYEAQGRTNKAIEQYIMAADLQPNRAKTHNHLGLAYKSANMPEQAIEQYIIAIKLDPYYAIAHNNLGNIYQELNILDKAQEELLTAIKINPNLGAPHFSLGLVYYKRGQIDDARREFSAGLQIQPDDQQARQFLQSLQN